MEALGGFWAFVVFGLHGYDPMPIRFFLLFLISLIISPPMLATQTSANPPNKAISPEVQSLNHERQQCKDELSKLQKSEDTWNKRNRWAGVVAIGAATLFGVAAFFAQSKASEASLKQRPDNDRIEEIDKRLREIDGHDSDLELEQAKRGIASANESAKYAEEEAAEANKKAADEAIERVRLEAQIAPRRLTIKQQEDIGIACQKMLSAKPIFITSYSQDVEGAALALAIFNGLSVKGMNAVNRIGSLQILGAFSAGVLVRSTSPDLEPLASCVAHALYDIGGLAVRLNDVQLGDRPAVDFGNPQSGHGSLSFGNEFDNVARVDILVAAKPLELAK